MNLSKSRYTAGLQCPKTAWMREHMPEQYDESVLPQAVLAQGDVVGDLAMGYFGPYVEVPFTRDFSKVIADTQAFLDEGENVVCEASFSYDGNFCSVDILRRDGDAFHIYEVKSSTHARDVYYEDASYQYWVLRNLGYEVASVHLLVVDNTYVRDGEIEVGKMFRDIDVTAEAVERFEVVGERVAAIKAMGELEEEPDVKIGARCSTPYDCPFRGWCWRTMPSPNVYDLRLMKPAKAEELCERGVVTFEDYRADCAKPTPFRKRQIECADTDEPYVDLDALGAYLDRFTYPLAFLDFETTNPAVPLYDGTRPYEQVPFQYSLHVQERPDAPVVHKEFLATGDGNPRRELAEALVRDMPASSTLIAYNAQFEKGVIRSLAKEFDDLALELTAMLDHVEDLIEPFNKGWCYQRGMGGSTSIKHVLPALFPDDPELNYAALEGVHKGDEASLAFAQLSGMERDERERTRRNLLDYCRLDTLAMVRIFEKLNEAADR
jgi:hypothetical protein